MNNRRIPTVEEFSVDESFTMGLKSHEKFYDDIKKVIAKHKSINHDDMMDALKTIINELSSGSIFESKVLLDTTQPDAPDLLKFVKKHNIKMKATGVGGGTDFEEYEYIGKKKDLEFMITAFWGDDELVDTIV